MIIVVVRATWEDGEINALKFENGRSFWDIPKVNQDIYFGMKYFIVIIKNFLEMYTKHGLT